MRIGAGWMALALVLAVPLAAGAARRSARDNELARFAAEYAPYDTVGTGVITGFGSAAAQPGLGINLAGRTVLLRPVTTWSRQWWDDWLHDSGSSMPKDPFANAHARLVTADSTGRFRFEGLPAGDYYVTARALWNWGGDVSIFLFGREVRLAPGEHANVALELKRRDETFGEQADTMSRGGLPDQVIR